MNRKRVAVLGAGITGLAAARRLQQISPLLDVQLYDAASVAGGVVGTVKRDGFLLENAADCFITEKPRGIGLVRELGLESELISVRPENRRSFILRGRRLLPIPEGFFLLAPAKVGPFLRSPLLGWRGKARVLAEPFIPCRALEDESLASFVRRRLGTAALAYLAQPLVAGIYAADPETLSLRATFPQFLTMEKQDGGVLRGIRKRFAGATRAGGARYGLFASFRDGMQTLTDRLIRDAGARLHLRKAIRRIHQIGNIWSLEFTDGTIILADAVLLALPAHSAAPLLNETVPVASKQLESIPYVSSLTMNVAFPHEAVRHPMNGLGYVVPSIEKRAILGVTFAHRKFAGRAPADKILLRAFLGGAALDAFSSFSHADLERLILSELTDALGIIGPPLWSTLARHPRSMPQFTLGHMDRIRSLQDALAPWPTLACAGSWQSGVGVPDCIASGEAAADRLFAGLNQSVKKERSL